MELLGHSQMRTTMDIYSHVMPALAREAADRMSAVLLTNTGQGQLTATTTAPEIRLKMGDLKKALVKGVELRGLEPLTPTLPGGLMGVRECPSRCISAGR